MSFYGNITNTNSGPFIFDKIYPNRAAMEANKSTDGVYAGRFVLVDYNKPTVVNAGSDVKNYTYVYKDKNAEPTLEGERVYLYFEENNAESILTKKENIGDIDAPELGSIYVVIEDGAEKLYRCVDFDDKGALFEYSGLSTGDGEVANALIDSEYITKDGRLKSYNSSVWQKVYVGDSATYILIADLNGNFPNTTIVEDAPTSSPLDIHFGKESTLDLVSIHAQPSWGMRVAMVNDEERKDQDRYSISEVKTKSDVDVEWTQQKENGDILYYNPAAEDGNAWGEEVTKVPAAIYFNKAGFDPETGVADEEAKDFITITPTGIGTTINSDGEVVKKSYVRDGSTQAEAMPNTQELIVQLPSIGNAMTKVWDTLYGEPDENGTRSANVAWEGADGNPPQRPGTRMIKDRDSDGFTFDTIATESISGCINSVHDLMGMIIIDVDDITNLDSWDNKHIYYCDGKYYRLGVNNQIIEIESANDALTARSYYGVYTINNENKRIVDGYYIKSNVGSFIKVNEAEYDPTEIYYQVAGIITTTIPEGENVFVFIKDNNDNYIRVNTDEIGTNTVYNLVIAPIFEFVEFNNYKNYAKNLRQCVVCTDYDTRYMWIENDEVQDGAEITDENKKYLKSTEKFVYIKDGEEIVCDTVEEIPDNITKNEDENANPSEGEYIVRIVTEEVDRENVDCGKEKPEDASIENDKYYTYKVLKDVQGVNFEDIINDNYTQQLNYYYYEDGEISDSESADIFWYEIGESDEVISGAVYQGDAYLYIYDSEKFWDRKKKLFTLFEDYYINKLENPTEYYDITTNENVGEIKTIKLEKLITDLYGETYKTKLGKINHTICAKELEGFGRDFNTIHGLILRINNKLDDGNLDSRNTATVQGALNRLEDLLNLLYYDYGFDNLEKLKEAYARLIDKLKNAEDLLSTLGTKDDTYDENAETNSLWAQVKYLMSKTQAADGDHTAINEKLENFEARIKKLETPGNAANPSGYTLWTDRGGGGISIAEATEIAKTEAKKANEVITFSWDGTSKNVGNTIWGLAKIKASTLGTDGYIKWAEGTKSTCSYNSSTKQVEFNFSISLKASGRALDQNMFQGDCVGLARINLPIALGGFSTLGELKNPSDDSIAIWRPSVQMPVTASPSTGTYVVNARILTYSNGNDNSNYYPAPIYVSKDTEWKKGTAYTVRIKGNYTPYNTDIEKLKAVLDKAGVTYDSSVKNTTTK